MAHTLGGQVTEAQEDTAREYGKTETYYDTACKLFKGLPEQGISWMSHGDYMAKVPQALGWWPIPGPVPPWASATRSAASTACSSTPSAWALRTAARTPSTGRRFSNPFSRWFRIHDAPPRFHFSKSHRSRQTAQKAV